MYKNDETFNTDSSEGIGKLKSTANNVKEDLNDAGNDAWDSAKEAYSEVADAAKDVYNRGKREIKATVGISTCSVSEMETYVSENPFKSFLIGVGAFVVASRLMRS